MEKALIPKPFPIFTEAFADALSNASAGAIALAWDRREKAPYDARDEIDDHVGNVKSVAHLQRWFNACKLGLTPRLGLDHAGPACRNQPNDVWNHLVQLHPIWKTADTHSWNIFATDLVRYAGSSTCLERFEAMRETAGPDSNAWSWDESAHRANRQASMQYLWDKGIRPLSAWVVNWFHSRASDRIKDPSVVRRWHCWDEWMAETVLPAATDIPAYETLYKSLYRYRARSERLSLNWARAPRLEKLLPYLPHLHLAAAWHNDPCWLAVAQPENAAWQDYAYLYRLLNPTTFQKLAPEVVQYSLDAPNKDVWNIAHALHWTWPQMLEYATRSDKKEGSLELPVDFAE